MSSAGNLVVLFALVSGYHRVWALECYCFFDPGESGLQKSCSGHTPVCNSTGEGAACFYHRSQVSFPSNAATVIVEYGCTGSWGDQCHEFEFERALVQCCYTDLCNQNFSKMLSSELSVDTPVATPTPAPSTSSTTLSPYIWAAIGVSSSVFVMFVAFVVSVSLMGVYVCYVQKKHTTQARYVAHSSDCMGEMISEGQADDH